MKSVSKKILGILKGKPKFDVTFSKQRQEAIEYTVNLYMEAWRETKNHDVAIQKLQPLLKDFRQARLDPLTVYKSAALSNPDDVELALYVANELCKKGAQDDEAVGFYRRVLQLSKDPLPYYITLEISFRQRDDISELASLYEQFFYQFLAWEKEELSTGVFALTQLEEEKARSLFSRTLKELCAIFITLKRYDKRIIPILERALEVDPTDLDAIELLAQVYYRDDRKDPEAVAIFETYSQYLQNDTQILSHLADIYLEGKEYNKALSLYQDIYAQIDGAQKKRQVLERIVHIILSVDSITSETVSYLIDYAQIYPKNKTVITRLAKYFVRHNDLSSDALDIYRIAYRLDIATLEVLNLLGKHAFENSSWMEAIDIYEKLTVNNSENSDYVASLAIAYAEYDRTDPRAVAIYEKAMQMRVGANQVCRLLSEYYHCSKEISEKAVRCFSETLRHFAGDRNALLGMCNYYFETQQYEKSFTESLRFLRRVPTDEQGIAFCARSLATRPSPHLLSQLKVLQLELQERIIDNARALNDDKSLTLHLAEIYAALPKLSVKQEAVVEQAWKFSPQNTAILEALSSSAYKKKEWQKATRWDLVLFDVYSNLLGAGSDSRDVGESGDEDELTVSFRDVCERLSRLVVERELSSSPQLIKVMKKSYQFGNTDSQLVLRLATDFLLKRDVSLTAMRLYQSALEIESDNYHLQIQLQYCRLARGEYEAVLDFCGSNLGVIQPSAEIVSMLLQALQYSKKVPGELAGKLKTLWEEDRNNKQVLLCLAYAMGMEEQCDEQTVEVYQRAVFFEPENDLFKKNLARTYLYTAETAKALKLFQQLHRDHPDDDEILADLARAYCRKGESSDAVLDIVKQAVQSSPSDGELQLALARVYLGKGLILRGVRLVDRLVELVPDAVDDAIKCLESVSAETMGVEENRERITMKLGQLYLAKGDVDTALSKFSELEHHYQTYCGELISSYGKIIKLKPNLISARVSRAILFKLVGDFRAAINDIEAITDEAKDNENVLFELLEIYEGYFATIHDPGIELLSKAGTIALDIAEYDRAIALYQRIVQLDNSNREAIFALGKCFRKKGSYEIALSYYKRLKKTTSVLSAIYDLAEDLYAGNHRLLAQEALNEIIAVDITYKDALHKTKELEKEILEQSPSLLPGFRSANGESAQRRFELEMEIGRGSTGIVYKAFDVELQEYVALKVLHTRLSTDKLAIERFRKEVLAARRLTYKNIVRIHDIGEQSGRRYISMEYVEGGNLQTLIQMKGRLKLSEALDYATQIARALAYAHGQGVLHRDIKPGNVLLAGNNQVKLSDFGIAALARDVFETEDENLIIGTPLYMSPEQVRGETVTAASEVYSLGIVLYEMLSGRPPFLEGNILEHHISTTPPELTNIPFHITHVVTKCLNKRSPDRYHNMKKLAEIFQTLTDTV